MEGDDLKDVLAESTVHVKISLCITVDHDMKMQEGVETELLTIRTAVS
jgi:hypothetical protein